MSINSKHAPYARETAICVDLAYSAMEEEIRAEIEQSGGPTRLTLERLLGKLRDRRKVLDEFTRLTGRSA